MKTLNGIIIAIVILFSHDANAATASSVSKHGITWTFNTDYEVGQFANGDWWVVGPVTINSITPAFDGTLNGWEVNPAVGTAQGFDGRIGSFSAALVPSLPYTSTLPVESIVKTISAAESDYSWTQTAAVLTVLSEIPANSGSTIFRPPYMGTNKPLYSTASLHTEYLPSLPPVGTPPTIQAIVDRFAYLRMEHLTFNQRSVRPRDAYGGVDDGYGPQASMYNASDILRLCLNDSLETKMPALIAITQHGIDQAWSVYAGVRSPGVGHDPGHLFMASFAAAMLDIMDVKTVLSTAISFEEDQYLVPGVETDAIMWGNKGSTEANYWTYVNFADGDQSHKDPYGYIDGGVCGATYQLIVAQNFKAQSVAGKLIPEVADTWNPDIWDKILNYPQRWVETGVWCQPDPCAPKPTNKVITGITTGNPTVITSNGHGFSNGNSIGLKSFVNDTGEVLNFRFHTISNVTENTFSVPVNTTALPITVGASTEAVWGYGTLYGPDPDDSPATCILDSDIAYYNSSSDYACTEGQTCGRFPANHGRSADAGQYDIQFVRDMWENYYNAGLPRRFAVRAVTNE